MEVELTRTMTCSAGAGDAAGDAAASPFAATLPARLPITVGLTMFGGLMVSATVKCRIKSGRATETNDKLAINLRRAADEWIRGKGGRGRSAPAWLGLRTGGCSAVV